MFQVWGQVEEDLLPCEGPQPQEHDDEEGQEILQVDLEAGEGGRGVLVPAKVGLLVWTQWLPVLRASHAEEPELGSGVAGLGTQTPVPTPVFSTSPDMGTCVRKWGLFWWENYLKLMRSWEVIWKWMPRYAIIRQLCFLLFRICHISEPLFWGNSTYFTLFFYKIPPLFGGNFTYFLKSAQGKYKIWWIS